MLVEGEHVHEEGKPERVEKDGGEKTPELKTFENVGLGENKLVGVEDVEAVEEGLDKHPGGYRSSHYGLLFPPANKVGLVVSAVVVIVVVVHHLFDVVVVVFVLFWMFIFALFCVLFFSEF